jgi:hypothetical protein
MSPDEPTFDYEVMDLVDTLRSYGVLTRDALLDRSGASRWTDHGFEAALRRGVESGGIKSLGEDAFEVGDDPPDLSGWEYARPKFPDA